MRKSDPNPSFDWWDERVTNEIYLSTNRPDWWRFCKAVAGLLADGENVLDVGTGDGHTFWQIISVASALPSYRINSLFLLEPNESGLRRAMRRCSQLPVERIVPYRSSFADFAAAWERNPERLDAPKQFDKLFAGHVNYYLAGTPNNESSYRAALDAMAAMAETLVIVTAPRDGDYYKMVPNPFGEYVYSDVVAEHYRSRGLRVEVTEMPMRFYIDHVNQSRHEAAVLWQFFSNTERKPSEAELEEFVANANKTKDRNRDINFKDQILVINT